MPIVIPLTTRSAACRPIRSLTDRLRSSLAEQEFDGEKGEIRIKIRNPKASLPHGLPSSYPKGRFD